MHASRPRRAIGSTKGGLPAHLEERLSCLQVGKTESGRAEDEVHTSASAVINITVFSLSVLNGQQDRQDF